MIPVQNEPPLDNPRRWPVRVILIAIVFALVAPGLVFTGVLLSRYAASERAQSQAEAQSTAVRIADSLDREIGGLMAALRALATSPALARGDLAAFDVQARAVADGIGQNVVLIDASGQQQMNTRLPLGAPLPRSGATEAFERVLAQRTAIVSDLFMGAVAQQWVVSVLLPVVRDGRVVAVLAMSLQPAYLASILAQQGLPDRWVASVVDGNDLVIARTVNTERFTGQLATRDLREHAKGERAVWIGTTLEGAEVLAASAKLRLSNWRVGVGVPVSIVEAPLRRTMEVMVVGGGLTLLLAGVLAWQLARSVAGPLQRLAAAGALLGQGLPVLGVRSAITEVDAVSRALVQATADLRSRADALAAERAQLAAIIETVPVGLLIAEAPSGRIVAGNAQIERMLRTAGTASAAGRYAEWTLSHADGRPVAAGENPLGRALAGEGHAELKCLCRRADGSSICVQLIAEPIRAAEGAAAGPAAGTVTGAVIAILDIDEVVRAREAKTRFAESREAQVASRTAELEAANQRLRDEIAGRARAEEQLRQSQKMESVGRLTGGIAHDFNNLLTIVIGSLDLLRRRGPEERHRRLLDNAMEGATRAATLTSRLLAFSRQQPLSPQPVDVNRLVAGMSDLLHRTLGESVQVETVLAGGLWQTHADPNQLENALLNLAVNARDAMMEAEPLGGRLTIETANSFLDETYVEQHLELASGQYVMVAVSDTGAGMAPDVVGRVFEPFYTTKPQGQGTGLGLSQVHGFVKQSGGHVTIYTELGQGTTVKIYLPRFIAAETPEPAAALRRSVADGRTGETVLVVEDEQAVRRFSSEALRELGYVVLEADGAAAALRLLDAHPEIALLFTDVVLPDVNGRALAHEAAARRPGLPVLFTTGYTRNAIVHNGQLDPGMDLIGKPFTVEALAAKLREVLDRAPGP